MLQIIKQENADKYAEVLSSLGLTAEEAQISEAVDNEQVSGYAVYSFSGGEILIHKIVPDGDLMLFDGIARSALFLAALKGIEQARFLNDAAPIAEKIKLTSEANGVLYPISNVFNACEHCKNKGQD